jgi:Skp family chaperone for outer membrane proteins
MFFKICNALNWAQLYRKCEKEKKKAQEENKKLRQENLEMKAKKDELVSTKAFTSRIGDALNREGEKLKHNGRH